MDGEKETAEDKEEEEEEGLHLAAASSVEDQDLPIMHWEDLSQRIAELEKQEQERRERSKKRTRVRTDDSAVGLWRDVWEEEEEEEEDNFRRCCVSVVASRFHQHRNLQLCFINDGDSEDEEDGDNKKVSTVTGRNSCHASGLKQEVVTALRNRRDELLSEQKEEECLSSSCVAKRKHLERWELQERREQQLNNMRATLQQEVHALSSELVSQLLVRDQLRTKQDAMLLDVQDMT